MLLTLPDRTLVLVDAQKLPRYWAAVWVLLHGGGLAPSTLKRKLSHIEALYVHTESLGYRMDDSIAKVDLVAVEIALEAFFVTMRNAPEHYAQSLDRWNTAFHFVRDSCERITRNPASQKRMMDIRERIARLDKLYLGLRPRRKLHSTQIRALPKNVVSEMLDAVTPGSATNPFEMQTTQWRMYCLVVLLLYQGLRRSETLVLRADSLTSQRDLKTGAFKWVLHVPTNEENEDPRAQRPSIKTVDSIRAIPITALTAEVIQTYLENYRGKVNHRYLLSSMRMRPLSIEGVNKAFERLTTALSPSALIELRQFTGAENLTPHALRHTCAVLRMKQMLAMGLSPEQSMANLRSFFGWSKTSTMPLHYAKAAFDERLNDTWNDHLDIRLELLKNLPQ